MKKRILSCLMALALCLTLLPATALAEDGHAQHCLCGAEHDNNIKTHGADDKTAFENAKWLASYTGKLGVEKSPGSSSNKSLPEEGNYVILEAGYYYLSTTADNCDTSYVKSYKTIKIRDNVTICLNGNQIQKAGNTTGPVFEVPSGCTLTLTDCKSTGQIVCNDDSKGSGVYVNGGILNLYSGQITQSYGQKGTDSNNKYGGGVYVGSGGTFNMYGGDITGNSANFGGGVYVKSGTFTMYNSASVTGNTASGYKEGTGDGGGVYVEGGKFEMNGPKTSVSGNTAATNGGGVYVERGTFTMNGNASITHNTANQDGGGVNAAGGTFAMNGSSKVMNNTGNGVYVIGGKFTVSGAPTVTGNTKDGDASNVYLTGSEIYITIGGGLTGDKGSIGVTKRSNSVIAKGVNEDYSGKFFSDDNTYEVKYKDTQLVLERTVVLQDPKYTKPTAKTGLFYTGEPQVLINEGSVEGGQMQYSLTSGGDYSDSLPTATNAGTYTVYYKVVGDASHNSVLGQQPIMVTIAKAQLSGTPTITKVTKAGTTLSAVVFKEPDGWPKGTVKWADKDGNELNKNTVVEAGIEYRWIFTPDTTDDAAKNYENTGGRVVLYENSGTVTPPSGGGSTGGNTGGTTGGTTGGNTGGSSGSSSTATRSSRRRRRTILTAPPPRPRPAETAL